jgi:1-aminocyclopropane-1-carboxylate deaminase/D-cysteine desulfhydrase-like pyridoxal-dependent ACC family enzyme
MKLLFLVDYMHWKRCGRKLTNLEWRTYLFGPFSRDEVIVYDDYTFGGYGVIDKDLVKVISDVAFKETILLDPVYTGKAMTGLIDLVNKNVIKKGSNILFIHTGGTPILFQYQEIISKYLEEIKRE